MKKRCSRGPADHEMSSGSQETTMSMSPCWEAGRSTPSKWSKPEEVDLLSNITARSVSPRTLWIFSLSQTGSGAISPCLFRRLLRRDVLGPEGVLSSASDRVLCSNICTKLCRVDFRRMVGRWLHRLTNIRKFLAADSGSTIKEAAVCVRGITNLARLWFMMSCILCKSKSLASVPKGFSSSAAVKCKLQKRKMGMKVKIPIPTVEDIQTEVTMGVKQAWATRRISVQAT
mmetsp:Transcript_27601/g.72748  ORF Transcript_27601/g.72748 Transcript_27601/m.72748 type:complete len:230 (-) Transcript_27601:267-956(-)